MNIGKEILDKLNVLSKISEPSKGVTRLYLTKEYLEARNIIESWMKEAGLTTRIDGVGNLIGEYKSNNLKAKTLVLGSHQDSVEDGGKFDGILGVILPIVCIKNLLKEYKELSCNIKIISFAYEEGTTYGAACLTSKVVAGTFKKHLLELEYKGKKLSDAMKEYGFNFQKIDKYRIKKEDIDTFLEVHIEQGPVLEYENLAVGIVTAIQSCNRYLVNIKGQAGHSGTIPMKMRKDAGAVMAEIIYKSTKLAEDLGEIVLTFGKVSVSPGAVNVIPGEAEFTIDIRAMKNKILTDTMDRIENIIKEVTERKKMSYSMEMTNEIMETTCSPSVIESLEKSFIRHNIPIFKLPSGAGHDAQEMANIANMGMLFVRCIDGISHNPIEDVREKDLDIAGNIIMDYIYNFERV